MDDMINNPILKQYWVKFYKECKYLLETEDFCINVNDELSEEDLINIKNIIINNFIRLKKIIKIIDQSVNLSDNDRRFLKDFSKILKHIVHFHPYMSSKFEDIFKLVDGIYIPIKSETLIGNDLLNDAILKNTLIENRYDLINLIATHKVMKNIGVDITIKHIESAVYINRDNESSYKLSINISEEELKSTEFFEKIIEIKEYLKDNINLDIEDILQFEVLEYEIDFSNEKVLYGMKKLEQLAIKLSIDDYGAFFSDLNRINKIRDLDIIHSEIINTVKIDKKITSTLCYHRFFNLLHDTHFDIKNDMWIHFLLHLSNILDIPYIELKNVLIHIESEKDNIIDILLEVEVELKINIRSRVLEELTKFDKLVDYIIQNNLKNKVSFVFEFIDNAFVKDIIRDIVSNTGIEVLVQGYYFDESIKPIFHKDMKDFINIISNNIK